jgi:hypothetical protein
MTGRKALDTLVDCLRDHDITADRDDLEKYFDGEHAVAIEEWIKEYLGEETLLTKDELSL